MNKRIKELIEECTDRHFGQGVGGFETFDKEKFAELIVKECMKLNHEHFSDEDPYSIDSLYRQHFGVEE
jgi:hypothetical protein